ncbi:MAG: hypothetical protein KF842_03685 [Caulobacter sp.]|nr:hypothetical protein [Caulobacter sp.]
MRIWKIIFALAALFNFLVGLPVLLAPAAFYTAIGQPVPDDLLSVQTVGLLISVFGVGYAMAARDPVWARPVLWLGVLGKAPLPVLVGLSVMAGRTSPSGFGLTLVDLVFAALFLTFLLRHRTAGASA